MLSFEYHISSRPKPGETVCGDCVAVTQEHDRLVFVVADGLGYGHLAASAAQTAVSFIAMDPGGDLRLLLAKADEVLGVTRGAAVTIVRVDLGIGVMTYAGVGNVELMALSRCSIRPLNDPGYLGGRVRNFSASAHEIHAGDLIVLFTDGISGRFDLSDYGERTVVDTAQTILSSHGTPHDDATCVVVRFAEGVLPDGRPIAQPRSSP
jgi:negative regulator of sigma-B (phosphoserine phosphatase)